MNPKLHLYEITYRPFNEIWQIYPVPNVPNECELCKVKIMYAVDGTVAQYGYWTESTSVGDAFIEGLEAIRKALA